MLIIKKVGTYLTVKEVAEIREMHPQTVAHWLKRGLPYVQNTTGKGTKYILKEDLEQFTPNRVGQPLKVDISNKT